MNLANNWSVGGRISFVEIRYYLLLELKEKNLIAMNWVPTDSNCCDLFTKSLSGPTFEWHVQVFCGDDDVSRFFHGEGISGRNMMIGVQCVTSHRWESQGELDLLQLRTNYVLQLMEVGSIMEIFSALKQRLGIKH